MKRTASTGLSAVWAAPMPVASIGVMAVLLMVHSGFAQGHERANGDAATKLIEVACHRADEAHQAVAVDPIAFYAITNRAVGRYDRTNGNPLARWTAPDDSPVQHLNSGIVFDGKLYCANSNWPNKPLHNTVEVFEAATLRHVERIEFPETAGAINWIERHDSAWWIVYAFYGEAEVRKTRLVKCDEEWRVTGTWTFPETVIQRFLPNSNSGGGFGPGGRLYVTGHDHAEVYVLEVPESPGEMKHTATLPAAITGQGIAWDRERLADGGSAVLYGIRRRTREVVVLRFEHND